jgi:glutathione S-transferase
LKEDLPILWSFRRCPYAMRARLGLRSAGIEVNLREILLRDKPAAFLDISKTQTVPVLVLPDGEVIEESRDIMFWALNHSGDPENWLVPYHKDKAGTLAFLDRLDGSFKTDLDRYKYATRFADTKEGIAETQITHRTKGAILLSELNDILSQQQALSGAQMGLLDFATLPFIRQFRLADMHWFDSQDWPYLHRWLSHFLVSDRFARIMEKYPPWQAGQSGVRF